MKFFIYRKIKVFYNGSKYFLCLLVGGIIVFIFYPNFVELKKLQAKHDSLKQKLYILKQKNIQLQQQINLLENSPQVIEKIAREKLGWAGPDELVYKF